MEYRIGIGNEIVVSVHPYILYNSSFSLSDRVAELMSDNPAALSLESRNSPTGLWGAPIHLIHSVIAPMHIVRHIPSSHQESGY